MCKTNSLHNHLYVLLSFVYVLFSFGYALFSFGHVLFTFKLCALLIWLSVLFISLCDYFIWLCDLFLWLCALFIPLCTLSIIRSFYALFVFVLFMCSFHVLFLCALFVRSLYVLFLCALFMCSFYALFLCALLMCCFNVLLYKRQVILHMHKKYSCTKTNMADNKMNDFLKKLGPFDHRAKFVEEKISTDIQSAIFKPLSYCFEETMGFDSKASSASHPVSHLIS